MKQDKVVSMILAVINVILVVVCTVLYLRTDRTEPRFVIQPAEISYKPGMDETALYEGIEAYDNRDGEITNKIVIEKKVENEAEGTVIVYYAVSDASGNVAKFSKLFPAEYPVEVSAAVSEAGREDQMMMELELDQSVPGSMSENGTDTDTVTGTDEGEDPEEDGEENDDAEDDVTDAEGTEADEETDNDDHADASDNRNEDVRTTPEPTPVRNTGAPELVFRSTEVTIDSGANVPWTEIISTLRDDKDDYATLYYNLQVSQYNRSKPGTYPVTVYTEDSDGNRSQTVPVTIIVR